MLIQKKVEKQMVCEKCGKHLNPDEEMILKGKTLCEDCYINTLSPTRTCDPWAVYTAKSFSGKDAVFNAAQKKILKILEETGGVEFDVLVKMLQMEPNDVKKEFATLRHMEKARGEMRAGKTVLCLW
jgi:hypothetical protein